MQPHLRRIGTWSREIFQDYRLRVGEVTFETDPPQQAPISGSSAPVFRVWAERQKISQH